MFRRYALVTIAFAGFFTAFFSPALFNGNLLTVSGDGSNIALPAYLIPHGLWEPDIMLGYPWAANFSGFWDPLFQLHRIPHSFNAYMLCAYIVAAVGTFGCVDMLTRSTVGSVVGGLSYALGGFMIGHLGHYDIVHAAAWTPFVFWAFIAQRQTPGMMPIVLGSLAIGLCALGGQPQVLAYTILFVGAYVLVVGLSDCNRRRYAMGALASFTLGIGLAAIALLPGMILALQSFRAQASLDYFLAYSIPIWQIPLRLFLPYVVGSSTVPPYYYSLTSVGNDAEFSGYVGISTLTLAAIAIITRSRDRTTLFLIGACIAAIILSAGDGFHIAFLTFKLPLYNLFRAQGRHMLEFTFLASILGGLGAAEIAQRRVTVKHLFVAMPIIGVAIALAIIEVIWSHILPVPASNPITNAALFIPVLVFVVSSSAIVLFKLRPIWFSGTLLALCTIMDMGSFAYFMYWRSPTNEALLQPPPATVMLKQELNRTHQRIFSVDGASPGGIPPNLSLIWGIPSAGGYVQMLLTSPGIFLQLLPQGTISQSLLLSKSDRSLDLASIRYIIAETDEVPAFLNAKPAWKVLAKTTVGSILENTNAEPRAHLFHRVVVESPDLALQAVRNASVDLDNVALAQSGSELDTRPDSSDNASITELRSDDMKLEVKCRTTCFLETSDNYNGMWKATIDGVSTPIRLTDYTFRGVVVPPGFHKVSFVYRPWAIWLGGAISITCALVLIVGACLKARIAKMVGSDYWKGDLRGQKRRKAAEPSLAAERE